MSNHLLSHTALAAFSTRVADYKELVKLRLTYLVMFSTALGYIAGAANSAFSLLEFFIVVIGGFMVVASANTINQIIERESDRLMKRTFNRPVAQGRVGVGEASIISIILGVIGVVLIGLYLNKLAATLALLSLLLYGFAYTPLKRYTRLAVHIGAIPGSLPPIIGYVAATGYFDSVALYLFIIQYVWQFPHFYAIAWILREDYSNAGLQMQPLGTRSPRAAAWQTFAFCVAQAACAFLYLLVPGASYLVAALLFMGGLIFMKYSYILIQKLDAPAAKKLMYVSIIYLPIIITLLALDQWL